MLNAIKYNKITKTLLILSVLISSSYALNANAAPVGSNVTIEDIKNIEDEGLNVRYQGNPLTGVPEGAYSKFEYSNGDKGISAYGSASYRYREDFSEYVNTKDETVTVLDLSGGLNVGGSLGCNGIDFGLEALFDFNAGDILEYLPEYIMTQLAVEALAQVYATPLISTVMDGIKSMRNATIDFKNAKCDMNKVMDRAEEIKNERNKECMEAELGKGYTKSDSGYEGVLNKCNDPNELEKKVNELKCSLTNLTPLTENIRKLLVDDSDYNTSGNGSLFTKGRMMALFLPDVKIDIDGGAPQGIPEPDVTTKEVETKAYNIAYTYMDSLYSDLIKSVSLKNLKTPVAESEIITKYRSYLSLLMTYGNNAVHTDSDSKLVSTYDDDGVAKIREQFLANATTSNALFRIGPDRPPSGQHIPNGHSDLKGVTFASLQAGYKCWVKVETSKDRFKWKNIQESVDAGMLKDPSSLNKLIDSLVRCSVLKETNFTLLHKKSLKDNAEYLAYIRWQSARISLSIVNLMITNIQKTLNGLVVTNEAILIQECKDKGLASLQQTATKVNGDGSCGARASDGTTGVAYPSCEEYAKQNKISEKNIAFINGQLETLKLERIQTEYFVETKKDEFYETKRK